MLKKTDLDKLPKTRQEAKEKGEQFYFNGIECDNKHICARHINKGCVECTRESNNRNSKKLRDNLTEEQKERRRFTNREWKKRNYERWKEYMQNWEEENAEYMQEWKKKYYREISRKNKYYLIGQAIGNGLRRSLNCTTLGKSWTEFVTFTPDEICDHLEKQFTPEMNWDNYGSYWCLDHIKPMSLCENFEECWNLENLQPLTMFDNFSKHNRYIGHPDNPQWVKKQDKNNDNNI